MAASTLRVLRPRPAATPTSAAADAVPPRPPRRRRRRVLVVVAVAGLGAAAWLTIRPTSGDGDAQAPAERVVEATVGPLAQTVSGSGTVEAADVDELSFSSGGTVTAVNVAAGDEVTAGDVLATIDSAELEAAVSEAEATVADAEARLDSDQDADASEAQLAADESSLASAEAQLAAAEDALAGAQLVATIDGTVSVVDLVVGDQLGDTGAGGSAVTGSGSGSGASAGTLGSGEEAQQPDTTTQDEATGTQIEVVSTGSYTVALSVDAADVELLEVGQAATVRLAGAGSTLAALPGGAAPGDGRAAPEGGGAAPAAEGEASGEVTSVGAIADASSGVASYPVEIAFTANSDDFAVGASVEVEITYEEVADAVQIPTQAVTTEGGTSTVTVRTDDGDEERTVELGTSSGGMVQVTSGVEAGEQVVVSIGGPAGAGDDSDGGGGGQSPGGFPGGGAGEPPGGAGGGGLPGGPPGGGGFPGGGG